jgi:hypothetical protein
MPSLHVLETRVRALEARLAEVEDAHGTTIYGLRRDVTSLTIGMGRILDHMGIPQVTEVEIDDQLDAD